MTAGEVGFPVYEVPAIARERFPAFDPADPATWPEPDRCTEGRPWGLSTYEPSGVLGGNVEYRWQRYLAALDAPPSRHRSSNLGCRNRWRSEEYRLCGTHLNPYLDRVIREDRRRRTEERRLQHVDLAKQLGAYGIVADGVASGVVLQADAVEALLRILAEADRVAPL